MRTSLLFLLAIMLAGSRGFSGACAAVEPMKVTLTLGKVTAERDEGEVFFQCEATLDNATDKVLHVRTSFFSAFDGVTLVVFDAEGKKLKQQPYTYHQSPSAPPGNSYPLEKGKNTKTLKFPLDDMPKDVKKFKVCLVGTLPGSEYNPGLLTTDLIDVILK